ncbi:MAG: hypothetical protein HC871_06545, partial [Rhizobiales bacterium]|nr:hypothetical protein [Hyphomicrobiales bacterium]
MARTLTLTERLDWLQLARSDGVGPKTFYRLLHRFGSARRAFDELPRLAEVVGAKVTIEAFRQPKRPRDYEIIVQVDQAGFVYHVLATMSLDGNSEGYYSAIYDSPLLASNGPPAVVNIEECVGLVELRYRRANGDPVMAGGGRVKAIETATDRL